MRLTVIQKNMLDGMRAAKRQGKDLLTAAMDACPRGINTFEELLALQRLGYVVGMPYRKGDGKMYSFKVEDVL
jgi:hypothetical protein